MILVTVFINGKHGTPRSSFQPNHPHSVPKRGVVTRRPIAYRIQELIRFQASVITRPRLDPIDDLELIFAPMAAIYVPPYDISGLDSAERHAGSIGLKLFKVHDPNGESRISVDPRHHSAADTLFFFSRCQLNRLIVQTSPPPFAPPEAICPYSALYSLQTRMPEPGGGNPS